MDFATSCPELILLTFHRSFKISFFERGLRGHSSQTYPYVNEKGSGNWFRTFLLKCGQGLNPGRQAYGANALPRGQNCCLIHIVFC